MRNVFIRIAAVLLVFAVFAGAQTETKSNRYAVITQTGGVVVRQTIEPGANMVMMAREGQRFEIRGEGKLWLEINTPNGIGFIPISACQIREGFNSNSGGAVILLLVLLGAVGVAVYLFYTKKGAVVRDGDDGNV